MHLYELTPMDELAWLMENKYVREVEHPTEPLRLLNYTDRAQIKPEIFAQVPALNYCRGLIWNTDNGEIVAQPFKKFWNHGQTGAAQIALDEPVYTLDKLDGSLGIMYRQPNAGTLAIATRGSFTSPQALHATALLRDFYGMDLSGPTDPREIYHPADDETFLFEIIYRENRIVLDYGSMDALVLLGSVDLEDGYVFSPSKANMHLGWQGPCAPGLGHKTLAEALAAPPRPNREGMVIATKGGGKMVKLKQEDYVRLHRLVTGLSERRVWEAIVAGETLLNTIEPLPDEFHPWVTEVWNRLTGQVNQRFVNLKLAYQNTMNYAFKSSLIGLTELDDDQGHEWRVGRAERAALAPLFREADDDQWAMWALLDGKDIKAKLWDQAKPEAGLTPNAPREE